MHATFAPGTTTGDSGAEASEGHGTTSGTTHDTGDDSENETGDPLPTVTCGNGVVEPPEECDDADDDLCDGCEECRVRTSLFLDGQRGCHVEVTDVAQAPLKLLSTPFTVEGWARVDEATDRVDMLRRGSGNTGWRVTLHAGGVVGTVFSGFDHIVDDLEIAGTGWHHVAWTYDLATSRIFLDGVLIGTMDMVSPILDPDAPMRIGAWTTGEGVIASYERGRVDEVRVSSTVRYVSDFEVQRRHEPDESTVLLLHFDEGGGMSVTDASGWGHTGVAAAVVWEPEQGYDIPMFCR